MTTRTRRVIVLIIVAFALYAVIHTPNESAGHVRDAFNVLVDAVKAILTFFDALLNRS
jgi:hypothetical protein